PQVQKLSQVRSDEVLVETRHAGGVRLPQAGPVPLGSAAHVHPDPAAGQLFTCVTSVTECLLADLEEEPGKWVHIGGGRLLDAEMLWIKLVDRVQKTTPPTRDRPWSP